MILRFLPGGSALALAIGLSVVGIASPAAAEEPSAITVEPHDSVQVAIDAVAPGGVVTLTSGTYVEEIEIIKSLTLRGSGAVGSVIIQQPAAATPNSTGTKLIDIRFTSNVTLDNLTLDGSVRVEENGPEATGVDAGGVDGLTLNNVTVKGFAKNGIAIVGQYKATTTKSSDVSFNSVTAENNGWAGIAFYSHSSRGVDANIPGVTFTGTTTITGNPYGILFGGAGDTHGVQGANGGPVSLGIVAFNDNRYRVGTDEYATNVIVSDRSVVQLAGASTVDGGAVASSDFLYAETLTLVPSVSTSAVSVSPSGSALTGTAVTITGTVSPADAVGMIEIFDGTTRLGGRTATGGVFTVVTSALRVGSHSLTARFTPDHAENYLTSTSTAVTFSVNNAEVPAPPPVRSPVQIAEPVAQQVPVVTEQTPPPPQVTAQIVSTELGSSTAQLLERYQAANNGEVPPPATEVLTIAAGEIEAGTGAILSTTNFVASMPWAGSSGDQWVDVWAYSTPTYIGTFPVINGVLKITGADLSALAAGDHHLVLVGQTSGASEVMGFAIAEPTTVPGDNVTADPNAATPDEAGGSLDLGWLLWAAIAVLAIAAIATIGTVVRRRRA